MKNTTTTLDMTFDGEFKSRLQSICQLFYNYGSIINAINYHNDKREIECKYFWLCNLVENVWRNAEILMFFSSKVKSKTEK